MILPQNYKIEKYGLTARFVEESDATFIIELRTDPSLSRFIHSTDNDIQKQIDWIRKYKLREKEGLEYYFIFSIGDKPCGLERIYDIKDDSYTHGSLVFSTNAPFGASIKADIITREIGFSILDKKINLFDVSKGNNGVITYHQRFKPTIVSEDEESYHYSLSKENFEKYKTIFMKLFKMN